MYSCVAIPSTGGESSLTLSLNILFLLGILNMPIALKLYAFFEGSKCIDLLHFGSVH